MGRPQQGEIQSTASFCGLSNLLPSGLTKAPGERTQERERAPTLRGRGPATQDLGSLPCLRGLFLTDILKFCLAFTSDASGCWISG